MTDIARVKSQFLANYAAAKIKILHDSDFYRHVVVSGATFCHFELASWPGWLFVNCEGDGFCFSRTRDMFQFFRCGEDVAELRPNFSYWAEKLTDPRSRQVRFFDYGAFERDVEDELKLIADEKPTRVEEIRDELENDVYHEDESSCREFLSRHVELEHLADGQWEDWTFRYAYACFAIVFGIREYDRIKSRDSEPRAPIFPAEWLA